MSKGFGRGGVSKLRQRRRRCERRWPVSCGMVEGGVGPATRWIGVGFIEGYIQAGGEENMTFYGGSIHPASRKWVWLRWWRGSRRGGVGGAVEGIKRIVNLFFRGKLSKFRS